MKPRCAEPLEYPLISETISHFAVWGSPEASFLLWVALGVSELVLAACLVYKGGRQRNATQAISAACPGEVRRSSHAPAAMTGRKLPLRPGQRISGPTLASTCQSGPSGALWKQRSSNLLPPQSREAFGQGSIALRAPAVAGDLRHMATGSALHASCVCRISLAVAPFDFALRRANPLRGSHTFGVSKIWSEIVARDTHTHRHTCPHKSPTILKMRAGTDGQTDRHAETDREKEEQTENRQRNRDKERKRSQRLTDRNRQSLTIRKHQS